VADPTPADLAAEVKRLATKVQSDQRADDVYALWEIVDALAAATREPPAPPEGKMGQAVATCAGGVAEGWKLVPIEPDDGMNYAGAVAMDGMKYDAEKCYRAMLAAAPVAPEGDSMVPAAQPYGWVIDGELVTEGNAYPADLERFKRLGTPVYLAQPAEPKERKPLTDKERIEIFNAVALSHGGPGSSTMLAPFATDLMLAVERAHGIQEQPKENTT
jgi:hypothetical protein